MEKSYHLYLTTFHCQESHSLKICDSPDLEKITTAIEKIIEAMGYGDGTYWFCHKGYARQKAEEFTKPFAGLLEDNSVITKHKHCFFSLGFIITNYPMWPDNKGGYENDFCI